MFNYVSNYKKKIAFSSTLLQSVALPMQSDRNY